jgi:hypothetical protein
MAQFLADIYALVEILSGNPNYGGYSQKPLLTTEFNIFRALFIPSTFSQIPSG